MARLPEPGSRLNDGEVRAGEIGCPGDAARVAGRDDQPLRPVGGGDDEDAPPGEGAPDEWEVVFAAGLVQDVHPDDVGLAAR